MMEKETRLPQNGKEFLLFLGIISIISVNVIAPLIMGLEFGFSKNVYKMTLQTIPFIWLVIVLLVPFVIEPLANRLVTVFSEKTDGFNAQILFHILFSVTILSVILTIIAPWIGQRNVSMDSIQNFFQAWPRNFFIAFWIEVLLAQPIARLVMKKIHSN